MVGKVLLLILGVAYFVPSIIALKENHAHKVAIILINIFLGWTFLGWLGALAWCFIN